MTSLFVAVACLGLGAGPAPAGTWTVHVAAGAHDRVGTPVFAAWPAGRLVPPGSLFLSDTNPGRSLSAQTVSMPVPGLVFVVDYLAKGEIRSYKVEVSSPGPLNLNPDCLDDGRSLTLRVLLKPVLSYATDVRESPEGVEPVYRRSGYLHPLLTPSGRCVTADFAPDHPHQHGLFFAWTDTEYQGHKVDFWNQKAGLGRVSHVTTLGTEEGYAFAGFRARLRGDDITGEPDEPRQVIDEVWTVRAYDTKNKVGNLVDFESSQTIVGNDPLVLKKYIYGGFGFRGNTDWYDPAATETVPPRPDHSGHMAFLTSEGKTRENGNHTKARWVDLSGDLQGHTAGVTVFGSPANFRSPLPVRLHPNKPYFSVSPAVEWPFTIEPKTPFVSRFRLYVHDGAPDVAKLEALRADYAEPPAVSVVEE